MRRIRSGILPLAAAAAGLALWLLARTDDPIPSPGRSEWAAPGAFSRIRSDHPELENLFTLVRATLRANRAAFRTPSGFVRGFAAGSNYPQIWIRDAATVIPASRFFYGAPYLESAVIEHLARQKPDGEIEDWFDGTGTAGKNTTESDQETSAVLAAGQITELIGPAWLRRNVDGTAVLDRLENALSFILRERLDRSLGLVKGAHTIDWGDVEMEEPDERAIRMGPNSHWTAGIYNQSQFYAACLELGGLWRLGGSSAKAAAWAERAAAVRAAADRLLWQESRGFYRVHVHITPLRHAFDEDAMFALGGNAEAVLSGLASPEKARRIFEAALARRKEFRISTISGVLLPPYPRGAFAHPLVRDPFEYQNGGQWDWFGGKLILGMFRDGAAAEAVGELLAIAAKDAAHGGLFEWDAPDGAGRGSARFSGSAGSLTRALIEGYYGIGLSGGGLTLSPRLGADSGAVHVYLPAAARFVGFDQAFDQESPALTITYASDWVDAGVLRVLWPRRDKSGRALSLPGRFDVRRDGSPIAFQIEMTGDDVSIRVETDWKRHTLRIRPDAPIR
ncbi:MAG: hypothetical protein ABSA30_07030 [Candidatus Aminicenantales bacterium]